MTQTLWFSFSQFPPSLVLSTYPVFCEWSNSVSMSSQFSGMECNYLISVVVVGHWQVWNLCYIRINIIHSRTVSYHQEFTYYCLWVTTAEPRIHCVCQVNRVQLFATLWTAPLSMGFSRQEYCSGFPSPPPGDLPNPWIKPVSPMSPALAGTFFTTSATWEAHWTPSKSDPCLPRRLREDLTAEVAPRQLQPRRSPLHGQPGALWQRPGNQGKRPTWKAALLIFQVQITHLFLAKVHISQVSSIPLGRTKSKINGSSPQVRQAVVGMNDCAGEAERRIYHPWDRLSSGGSGKVRMISGNVLQPGVTYLPFCFTVRIKHVNHTLLPFLFYNKQL